MPGSPLRPPRTAQAARATLAAFAAFALALASVVGLSGCAADNSAPELLHVLDVAPRDVDVGDRIEVLGTNLPTGEAREAKVTFRGQLRRPGRDPVDGVEITV